MSHASRTRWTLAAAAFALHLPVAHRYDFFRDELYFIACGRRPSFGYADQPPVVPLLAAATQLFGENLVLLRMVAALGAFGVVWFTCKLAERMEAGPVGVMLAGVAAATAPMDLGLVTTLSTSSFEPLAWTAVTYFVARAVLEGDARAWLWAGLVAGLDLEVKYQLPLYLVPLILGVVVAGHGRALLNRHALLGGAIAAAIALPSLLWQLAHGLPFLELVGAGASGKNRIVPAGEFLINQALVMNPVYAALALVGLVAPFASARFHRWRFVPLTFAFTLVVMLALHAKDYYFAPAYGPVFALGGAAVDAFIRRRWLKLAPLLPALAYSAIAAPLAMPILSPAALAAYMRAIHQAPSSGENLDQSDIPQEFADMLGWRHLASVVADAVHSLPPPDRERATILGRNYGESAALQFYGPGLGVRAEQVIGRHNQYWLWGPGDRDGSVLILIGWAPEDTRGRCEEAILLGRAVTPHAMPYENRAPISLCRGLRHPLSALWPELKLIR